MLTVKLKKESKGGRVLKKHPWVYLDELSHHIKSVQPGFPVRLVDDQSRFIAYGIGNPQSQIAFRAWSFNEADANFFSADFLIEKLTQMWVFKHSLGFKNSFRVCFSEGDGLSGIIIDRYLLEDKKSQIIVIQLSTSTFEVLNPNFLEFLTKWLENVQKYLPHVPQVAHTALIVRRSQAFAEVENLKDKKSVEVICDAGLHLCEARVMYSRYPYRESEDEVCLESDFIEGQKTGLFLDQSYNIGLVSNWAKNLLGSRKEPIKILDLCCYRGAWAAHLSHHLKQNSVESDIHLVDQAQRALDQAKKNVSQYSPKVTCHQGDVMSLLDTLDVSGFDIIISDPPAFAKSKKALNSALEGYYHLNRKALKLANSQALFVACSCSSVVSPKDLQNVIERSLLSAQATQVTYLGSGGHALDHSLSPFFPEGEYLKMRGYWITKQG